jgi:hypothetical protein
VNTKYFQFLANGRHGKSRIFQLQDGSHNICGNVELKKYITSHYKNLFGLPQESSITLDETRRDDILQVTEEENRLLVENFLEEEVKKRCSRWNIINHWDLMVFRLSFIKYSGW